MFDISDHFIVYPTLLTSFFFLDLVPPTNSVWVDDKALGQSVGLYADNAKGERVQNIGSRAALNADPADLAVDG